MSSPLSTWAYIAPITPTGKSSVLMPNTTSHTTHFNDALSPISASMSPMHPQQSPPQSSDNLSPATSNWRLHIPQLANLDCRAIFMLPYCCGQLIDRPTQSFTTCCVISLNI